MPVFQRRKTESPSFGSSSMPGKTRNGSSPSSGGKRPLTQARLDRISRPTAVYYHSYCRWFIRLSLGRETYPAAEMKAQLQEVVGPEVCRLEREVRHPPETLTGDAWEALEDRWRKLLGKMDALAAVLELRAKEGPQPARTYGKAWPATPILDPTDPFAAEE